jgi:drug/metabolite transporter (DMT)-like permease
MIGILAAVGALISWAVGDFAIQRATRKVGTWKTLFTIGLVAFVGLLPLVWRDVDSLVLNKTALILSGLSAIVMFVAALFDFEALKHGKLAIIEPLLGLEVPVAVGLSIGLWGERLSQVDIVLIVLIVSGLVLTVTQQHGAWHYPKTFLEKGVLLGGLGAVGMGLTNFLVGVSSQQTSPLLSIWFIHSLLVVFCGAYLLFTGELKSFWRDVKKYPGLLITQGIIDNLAWVFFAAAVTYIPIAIATAISESYIILAVLLGVFVNKEKLKFHQIIGIAVTIVSVVILSSLNAS